MTPEDYHAMSDRERDALVGKYLFGVDFNAKAAHGTCCYCPDCHQLHDDCMCDLTTTWTGMEQVVEKADAVTLQFNPYFTKYGRPGNWEAQVTFFPTGEYIEAENRYEGEGFGHAYADTAPAAVAEAALKALEVIDR